MEAIHVSIRGSSHHSPSKEFNLRQDVFSIGDDSLLVRYRTYTTLAGLTMTVTHNGGHVGGSPFHVPGPIQPHNCHCPAKDFDQWLRDFGCTNGDDGTSDRVAADLSSFGPHIDMDRALAEAEKRFASQPGSHSFCHYAVRDNVIGRRCYGEHTGFKMFPDSVLSLLSKMVRLPDVRFLINLGDWPLVKKDREHVVPMISWCRDNATADALLPTYELTEASVECMGRSGYY